MRKPALIALAAVVLICGGITAIAHAATNTQADCVDSPGVDVTCTVVIPYPAASTETVTPPPVTATATVTTTATVTASPSSSATPTPTPTSTPTPTPTATPTQPPTGFPDSTTTGVPDGTQLKKYTGPCTITAANVTLDKVDATSCGAILVMGANLRITNSRLPRIDATNKPNTATVSIAYSDVNAAGWVEGALWGYNISADHVDVVGGQHSFHCNDNCVLTESYLHDQTLGKTTHNNGFISNGGSHMVIRHNTLWCSVQLNSTGGGCSGDLSLFGDFDPVSDVVVERNLFKANNSSISYCMYGGNEPSKPYRADHVVVTGNVFERGGNRKCGVYGAVTSFDTRAAGNVWSGNTWSTGEALAP